MDENQTPLHTPPDSPPNEPSLPSVEPVITPTVTPLPVSSHEPEEPLISDNKRSFVSELFSTVGILVVALLVALFIIAFVFRSYQVDGPSMQNTLQNSDKLIIWKVPRTWSKLTHHQYVPNRGDIIVFSQSGLSEFGQTDTKQLIKRVIGMPGERVVVKDGAYTVYNKENPKGFNPDVTLGYGRNFPTTSGDVDVVLAKDQIFVSGDNRPDSLDSRSFGPINTNQVVGKLVLRVFPISSSQAF